MWNKSFDLLRASRLAHPRRYAGAAVLVIVIALLYKETFAWLVHIWWADKEQSHGFLVPLVSGYLIWRKRELLMLQTGKPAVLAGCGLVLLAVALYVAGRCGGVVLAEGISFLLLLPGLTLFIKGWETLKALVLPLAYLQFMVPWMEEFIDRVHGLFQHLSAWFAVALMRVTDVPVALEGRYILIPNMTLEVAKECSGVQFLTSVIALGLPLVYISQTKWSRALAVLSSGVLITILVNSVRIALAGNLAYRFSPSLLHGPFHILQGWFVAQVGFIALVLINWLVVRRGQRGSTVLCDAWKRPGRTVQSPGTTGGNGSMQTAVAIMLLAGTFSFTRWYAAPKPVPAEFATRHFPETISGWTGTDHRWIHGESYFPGVDFQVERRYSDANGSEIFFYLGYFEVQKQGKSVVSFHERSFHDAGERFEDGSGKGPAKMQSSEVVINGVKYRVLLWYRLGSRYVTGRYAMKAWTVADSLLYRRNNAAVYIVAVPLTEKYRPGDWEKARGFGESIVGVIGLAPRNEEDVSTSGEREIVGSSTQAGHTSPEEKSVHGGIQGI